ncbi:MAG: hypothetical protein WC819_02210 [Parcubacteria group bacterium]|jgi:hypothetical protein
MKDDKKVIFKKNTLFGGNMHTSDVIDVLKESDTRHSVFNRDARTKEIFQELKNVRDNNVTKKELKTILADHKYGEHHFDRKGIDAIAESFDLGRIEKKHCSPKMSLEKTDMQKNPIVKPSSLAHKPLTNMNLNIGANRNLSSRLGGGASVSRVAGMRGR